MITKILWSLHGELNDVKGLAQISLGMEGGLMMDQDTVLVGGSSSSKFLVEGLCEARIELTEQKVDIWQKG